MSSTAAMRRAWSPACKGSFSTITLYGGGRIRVKSAAVPAFLALNACLERHDYKAIKGITGAFNCRKITGGKGYSLHAYGIAADLNWTRNPYGPRLITDMPKAMIADIKSIRANNGARVFRWGGDYRGNKDAMHFEVICAPADLATGIRGGSHHATAGTPMGNVLQLVADCSTHTLRKGDKGQCVKVLQQILATKFNHPMAVDSQFGPATDHGVRDVQRWFSLTVDGVVGPQTWKAMSR